MASSIKATERHCKLKAFPNSALEKLVLAPWDVKKSMALILLNDFGVTDRVECLLQIRGGVLGSLLETCRNWEEYRRKYDKN